MTPGKLRALLKDLWQNSPITFALADGTPLRIAGSQVLQENTGDPPKPAGPPSLTIWLEQVTSADAPPPQQTVHMELTGSKDIDEVATP